MTMKIERISDNQIRCTLNKADLAGKETLLNELAFGSDKAKGLFRELMKKASQELGFETNNIPLMVEAIPVSQECLILVVTKVEDADQFNDRYEKLVNSKISSSDLNLEDSDGVLNFLDDASDSDLSELADAMHLAIMDSNCDVYCFSSLEEVAYAAKLVISFPHESRLYKDTENNCYYLCLSTEDNKYDFTKVRSILSEYSKRIPNTYATKALFNEHFQTILSEDAIRQIAEF